MADQQPPPSPLADLRPDARARAAAVLGTGSAKGGQESGLRGHHQNGADEMTALAVMQDPTSLDTAADPARSVLIACGRAQVWLAKALAQGDIDQIVELKSQAEAVRVYTRQKQLGEDAALAAAEIVRRAERGLGLAVRRGQDTGEIAKYGGGPTGPYERTKNGRTEVVNVKPAIRDTNSRSSREFFAHQADMNQTYAVTDGVSDGQFEDALEAAKAEGNLSRANVVRKVRGIPNGETTAERWRRIADLAAEGYTSRQIAPKVGMTERGLRQAARERGVEIPADVVTGRARHLDPERIVRETVTGLEGLSIGVGLLTAGDFDQLQPRDAREWADSLGHSIRTLNHARFASRTTRAQHRLSSRRSSTVSKASNGNPNLRSDRWYLIDGQHRIEALKQIGWGDQQIQCWAYQGLTEQEEAEKFLKLNTKLTVAAFSKFRVGVQAGRTEESDIDRIVRAQQLRVSTDKGDGAISCVGTLRRVYKQAGPATLARTLRIIRDAYGDAGLDASVLAGIGLLCQRYNGELDDTTAVERLAGAHGGVNGLLGKAEHLRRQTGNQKTHCVAAAAVEIINSKRGGKRLPSWWKADA